MKKTLKIFGLNLTVPFTNGPDPGAGKIESKQKLDPFAFYDLRLTGWTSQSFDGEKNLGELGPPKNYVLNYDLLRVRSWQSFIESEISQTIIKKFRMWVIGSGLKLQSNPIQQVLKSEGIDIKPESFNEIVETRFAVWANSKKADYANEKRLHAIAKTAFVNAIIGGDVVVVLRVKNALINVQLIDGCHLQTPGFGNDLFPLKTDDGNIIKNGIEMDATGKHIAYHIRQSDNTFKRIEAYNNGMRVAYMVFGGEYRIDNSRGMPLLSVILETLKKLERYKEAVVGSAEERQKIPYYIKHGTQSTGENPLISQLSVAVNPNGNKSEQIPEDVAGEKLANKIAVTTEKMVFNMPNDAELQSLESKNELYFEPFYKINASMICAALNIPPEVAFSKYDSNFSASRAAMKDWEHTLNVARDDFGFQFYQPIYELFLHIEILKSKINAPKYMESIMPGNENVFILEAYRSARYIGPSIPHIDPLKEVKAIREKLGPAGAMLPLTTLENATEELNGGDSDSNIRQFSEEIKDALQMGVIKAPKNNQQANA